MLKVREISNTVAEWRTAEMESLRSRGNGEE
jgi:hypothetical protein